MAQKKKQYSRKIFSPKRRKTAKKQILLIAVSVFFALLLLVAAGGVLYVLSVVRGLPPPEEFGNRMVSESTKIYDRTGKILLYEIHGEEKRTVLPFDEIPERMKQATLAAEDAEFYSQPAFNWKGIIRAFLVNLKEGRIVQGGSTITQQLVKNVFLTSEKTYTRKLKEIILAIELESRYSKDEILGFYLNQIPYGGNAYGVEAASQTYFNKSAGDLSLGEIAVLAAITKAPTYYSPWGPNKQELFARQAYVLDRMVSLGYITEEERDAAKKEELKFAPQSLGAIKAPHFSLAVKDFLVSRYGEQRVLNGGLRVRTTLNWDLQEIAERVVLEGAERNSELYGGTNAALVAEDPKTGEVLALVGSKDYFNIEEEGNFNVATQGLRQPGSALKPFVYLTAFQKGYQPTTKIFDVSTEFDTTGKPENSYRPENFDGIFRGPVSLEAALAQSINVPAVKMLYLASLEDVLANLRKIGIDTLKERWRYGLSLVLGGGEVRLVDLVNAYAVLAEEGVFHTQRMVLEVRDSNGRIVDQFADKSERVFPAQYPRLINQILSDGDLRRPLYQASFGLTVFPGRDVALKTGTTDDYRDAWAFGYTPSLVVGVWAGNNDNTPMRQKGSSILAAIPMWNAFLKEALEFFPPEFFTRPDPLPRLAKPMLNGEAYFTPVIDGVEYPQVHSILYYVDKNNPLGPAPGLTSTDFQFANWELGVLAWARANIPNFSAYNRPLPRDVPLEEPVLPAPTAPLSVSITEPENGSFITGPFTISADVFSEQGLKRIELSVNRETINGFNIKGNSYHYQYFFNGILEQQNLIELKAIDETGEERKESVVVFLKN